MGWHGLPCTRCGSSMWGMAPPACHVELARAELEHVTVPDINACAVYLVGCQRCCLEDGIHLWHGAHHRAGHEGMLRPCSDAA